MSLDLEKLHSIVKKHALKNADEFGKANPKSIVGKLIAEYPECKKDMKTTMKEISKIVSEVNNYSKEKIKEEMGNFTYQEKIHKERQLTLPNAKEGCVITRFPPEPSGYSHIGHAKAIFLNRVLADQYKGKMILRFDDTNPEKEKQEYVEKLKEAIEWLGVKYDFENYSSDKIQLIYDYAYKVIDLHKAYVCFCSGDKIKENRQKQKECSCRDASCDKTDELFTKMLNGEFKKGEAILRLKGDMKSLNTVMRDPTLFRIIDLRHYRQGYIYKVWPSYDFATPILDSIEGVTHTMRTKEYELRRELFFEILEILKLRKPELIEYARLKLKGTPISKRKIVKLVKEGKVEDWSDPRLATIESLKRRGITPEAIKNFVLRFGLTKAESEPGWEILLKENRKVLDAVSDHYFFVEDPKEFKFDWSGEKELKLKLNPKSKQTRTIPIGNKIYLSKKDVDTINKDGAFALKDLSSVLRIDLTNLKRIKTEELPKKKFQWVSKDPVECEIIVPKDLFIGEEFNSDSLEVKKGYCEPSCLNLKVGDIIQFERFGFVRLDKKENNKLTFIFSC